MNESRFVRPETCVLKLANGDALIVKKRLTAGEQRRQYARAYIQNADGKFGQHPIESGIALILAYLVDWTLADEHGTLAEIRGKSDDEVQAAVDQLDWDSFVEIKQAIEAHEVRMVIERAAQKKTTSGAPKSTATSPSRDDAAGDTNGSGTLTPTSTSASLPS